jgi:hypothetical protein
VLSAQTQPCWPSAAADPLQCDRVDAGFAHGPRRPSHAPLNTMVALPELRERAPVPRIHNQHSSAALVCSFIKQATANVRLLPMVAAVAHCRATSTRAADFLKATCLGQPLCVEPDAICEIRSTRDAPPPASYLAVGWSVTNAWLNHGSLARSPLGPAGWRGRSGQQGCQG